MPGFVAFFLTELMSIPRFNLFPLWRSKFIVDFGYTDGGHNELFNAHDYESVHLFANLAHILFLYVPLILLVWLLAFIKDTFVRCRHYIDRS